MSEGKGLLTRLRVKLMPQLVEDWIAAPGDTFRRSLGRFAEYFDKNQIVEKVEHAHDLGWRALEGAASAQHAKAEADYAKAENDRIEAELKRKTLAARTRHECADADKAEAEAAIAKTREIQARLELFKQLQDIGVGVAIDSQLNLIVSPAPILPAIEAKQMLTQDELAYIVPTLVEVSCPDILFEAGSTGVVLVHWLVSVGSRVEAGQPIFEISTPQIDSEIPSPTAGVIIEILVQDTAIVGRGELLAKILPGAANQLRMFD
jgi:biotin carboxyl carrier protein